MPISGKLNAVQVQGYVCYLGRSGYQSGTGSPGYLANGYACQGLTPREQYQRFADGRDEGLQDLPPDDPEAFVA